MRAVCVLALAAGCSFAPGTGARGDAPHTAGSDAPPAAGSDATVAPDTALPTCSDGVKNGDELEADCGGSCPACARVFDPDDGTLAIFELNGDTSDSSGHARDATLIGGTFVATSWGEGLSVPGGATQGFQWSSHASLLVHPYTIEMVITPNDTSCWKKLFGPSDALDNGWHYCASFQTYPSNLVGPVLAAHQRDYFAVVSTSATNVDVYWNGAMIGSTSASFSAPPPEVIFFRDDISTARAEALSGVIDAVRLSKVARTPTEIMAVATRLAQQP